MKRAIIAVIAFCFSLCLSAQMSDSTYLEYLSNPKKIAKIEKKEKILYNDLYKNEDIFKTDIAEIPEGQLPIILEHNITNRFSIDGGVGVILPFSMYSGIDKGSKNFVSMFIWKNLNFENNDIGSLIYLQPKLYLDKRHSFSTGISYKLINYNKLMINEFGLEFCFNKTNYATISPLPISTQLGLKILYSTESSRSTNPNNYLYTVHSANELSADKLNEFNSVRIALVVNFGIVTKCIFKSQNNN